MQFSGAYNSLYIYRGNEFITLKADKQPIGIYAREKDFTNHEYQLQRNDILYSFSDGFSDQFNPDDEKYKIKRFRILLKNNANRRLTEQKEIIDKEFNEWKSGRSQMDDIIVIGIKI